MDSMLPDPLHPAVVHLPIALAVLMPLLAAAAAFAIARGLLPARAWLVVAVLQLLLVGSAWTAVETGENEEERVERIVAEQHIEAHEEAADRFLIVAGVAALLLAAGLLPDRLGRAGRVIGTLASLAVLAAAVSVGHSGGELVYRHGAASAYTAAGAKTAEHGP
jgi:uncharacterized membrane protein